MLTNVMKIESVNIAQAETISHRSKSMVTGICKRPVSSAVEISSSGVAGDCIVDTEHHGGADQAVYAYSADDYDWWANETGVEFAAGLFGENLTIRGLPSDIHVGDRLLISEVVLEATAPRIPCGTFAMRMQDSGFGMMFRKAERPGCYFRVLSGGVVQSGDAVTHIENHEAPVSIVTLFRAYYALQHDAESLRRYLEAPLASRLRAKFEAKLADIEIRPRRDLA